ncbi:MAG: HAMP domain-containing sensor histidine kinase [Nannocystaceae bacterium]
MSRSAPRSVLGRGRATAQDILAWVAALLTSAGLLSAMTTALTGDVGTIPALPTLIPPVLGIELLLLLLARGLPSGARSLKDEHPWWRLPLYVVGFLALPAIGALHLRRRGERTMPERWLRLPRWVATRIAGASALIMLCELPLWLRYWALDRVVEQALLYAALTCTMVLIAALGVRVFARRELLLMPTAVNVSEAPATASRRSLVMLVAANAGLTIVPLTVAHLWLGAAALERAREEAATLADDLLEAARAGHEERLGALLARHPGVSVRSALGTLYGTGPDPDSAAARSDDRHLGRRGDAAVSVPVRPKPLPAALPFAILALLCLSTGALAAAAILREVDDDAADAAARLRGRVATSEPRTDEWRALAPKIDALLDRIADTELARYLAEEAVDEADRRRLHLIAATGADLRPSLDALGGLVAQLASGGGGPRGSTQQEALEAIEAGADHLQETLGELAEMAALAEGRLALEPRPLALASVLAEAIQSARRRHPRLVVELTSEPGIPPVFADRRRLVAALTSLLAFASQRLEGEALTIRASYDAAHELGIRVHLSAPKRPMSEVEAGIARRPFHRLSGQPGLGLDLARADGIIRLSNGRLDLQAFGEGMRFTIDLPAAAPRRVDPALAGRYASPA